MAPSFCALLLLIVLITSVYCIDLGYELLKAAETGNTTKVVEILDKGVPLNTRNNNGVSPVNWAANNGNTETLEVLLDRGGYIEDRSNNGRTPLAWASRWGHISTVIALLNRGANISAIDVDGMTPLMHAVSNSHVEVVKLLIDKGAPITSKNFHDGTALSIAKIKGNKEIIDMLEHHFPKDHEHSVYYLLAQHLYLYFKKMVKRGVMKAEYHLGYRSNLYMETEL